MCCSSRISYEEKEGRVELLWIRVRMHLRRKGLLHELRKHVLMVQRHLEPVASSVRKLWSSCVGGRGRHKVDILMRGDRLGRWLRSVCAAKGEMGSRRPLSVSTPLLLSWG